MFHARAATRADRESLVGWMHALYAEDPSPSPMTREKATRTLDALERDPARGQAVVLEASGAPAGYALLASVWNNELGGVVCVVDEIYVSPTNPRARALHERLGFRAKRNAVLRFEG